jgi:hypothetical protein
MAAGTKLSREAVLITTRPHRAASGMRRKASAVTGPRPILILSATSAAYIAMAWMSPPGFYDGFAPTAPYNWVSPPPQSAAGNKQPLSGHVIVKVSDGQSQAFLVSTDDGQARIDLSKGAFEVAPGTNEIVVDIKPQRQYPAISGFQAGSNVYLLSASAPLKGAQVVSLMYPGDQAPPSNLFFAGPAARTWSRAPEQPTAATYYLSGTVTAFGYLVAGSPTTANSGEDGSTGITLDLRNRAVVLPLIAIVAVGIVLLVALPFWLRSRANPQGRRRSRPKPASDTLSRGPRPPKSNRGGARRGDRRRR